MQNDVLKNNIAPWQEKGRWIKITCESDQSTWSIVPEESDTFFEDARIITRGTEGQPTFTCIDLDSDEIKDYRYKIIDLKVLLPEVSIGTIYFYTQYFCIHAAQNGQYIVLCPANQISGKVVIYAYIYIE